MTVISAFKGQPYRGLVGPNEREIPSVRAPDGSLIYLVDTAVPGNSIYDSDFVVDPQTVAKGGLQRIDHMAMALPADSLDSWVLFYKSILDFEADDEVVLPRPVWAGHSRCSTVRLPLNISENRNTAISHALSSYRGSGVHHIAFSCEDIFAEVSRAKEAGVPLLDIPLNYYDDLAARFDFDDEFLSELAYFNVLYDRDAQGGELFHVYTDAFDGRFFFEILQRKNDYVGYGAANVPVRLAAMAKARPLRLSSVAGRLHTPRITRGHEPTMKTTDDSVATRPAAAVPKGRKNNPEKTREDILKAAVAEFVAHGLTGARVDAIAERTKTSKRMIYYYFGSKEQLYVEVLEKLYGAIRNTESELNLGELEPVEAIQRVVEFTFDHHDNNVDFVRIVCIENIHNGENVKQSDTIQAQSQTVIKALDGSCVAVSPAACSATAFTRWTCT